MHVADDRWPRKIPIKNTNAKAPSLFAKVWAAVKEFVSLEALPTELAYA